MSIFQQTLGLQGFGPILFGPHAGTSNADHLRHQQLHESYRELHQARTLLVQACQGLEASGCLDGAASSVRAWWAVEKETQAAASAKAALVERAKDKLTAEELEALGLKA